MLPLALSIHAALTGPGGGSWCLFFAVLCISIGLVFYFYRVHSTSLDRRTLVTLTVLRIAAAALLVLMLFRPTVRFERKAASPPVLSVLLDTSSSMKIHDYPDLPDRFRTARHALLSSGEGIGDLLEKDFNVNYWTFDSSARPTSKENLVNVEPDGPATDLAAALGQTVTAGGETVSGVILVSDGIDTTGMKGGRSAIERGAAFGVPVHAVSVGTRLTSGEDFRDISLRDVQVPRRISAGSEVELRAYVDAVGFEGRECTVVMASAEADGRELARASVVLDNIPGDQMVRLRWHPKDEGVYRMTARVPTEPSDRIVENNEREFVVRVSEARVNVLYVAGSVGPEMKYLKRTLESDPDIDVISLIKVRKGLFRQFGTESDASEYVGGSGYPETEEDISRFDVILFADIDSTHFSEKQMKLTAEVVRRGGGFGMLWGRASFGAGGYGGTEIAGILPVETGSKEDKMVTGKFAVRMTPQGRLHPALTGCERFFSSPKVRLPAITSLNSVSKVKRTGEVLLEAKSVTGPGRGEILLATGRAGKGRTAVFAGGPTWPWCLKLEAAGLDSPYSRLWGQLVRWLGLGDVAAAKGEAGVKAFTDKVRYQSGEKVTVTARVRGHDGLPTDKAKVRIQVEAPEGEEVRPVEMTPETASRGAYQGSFVPGKTGTYTVTVRAFEAASGKKIGESGMKVQVERPNVEMNRVDFNEDLLMALADVTGGTYSTLDEFGELAARLRADASRRRRTFVIGPWGDRALGVQFVLFVMLVGAEWAIRRRIQLS